ncbi:MAG: S8 family serine peptidase [Anaerolineae bacterium]
MKRNLLASLLVLSLGLSALPVVAGAASGDPSTYIVVFHEKQDPEAAARDLQQQYGIKLGGVYQHALKGAVIHASVSQVAEIEKDYRVRLVEPNRVYSIATQEIPTGIQRVYAGANPNLSIGHGDDLRVDADVAVIDTGIDLDHPDLNLAMAIDCTWSGPNEGTCAGTRDDGHGHGTHVAGTIGALDNDFGVVGVAPGVRLWAVKVLTNYGTGTTAQVIAGIDWIAKYAGEIEVANMSLGGVGESEAMDKAIEGAVGAGVTFVLAAGNRAMDVDNYHPAGQPDAITVSALADFDGLPGGLELAHACAPAEVDDTLADFTNFGMGVDLAAPGVCIYSTYLDGGYATMSGTSMAAPHVSGAAAILASTGEYSPAEIKSTLAAVGNLAYESDEWRDGEQEPLLDLSTVTVFAPRMIPGEPAITLEARGYTDRGWQQTDLSWSGTVSSLPTDLYRDGAFVGSVAAGETEYTDDVREKGGGMHFYWVCQTDVWTTCSNVVVVDTY